MTDEQTPARDAVPDATTDATPDWAHSFGGVVDAYERGRPTYPEDAVRWLLGETPATVLELGAGTGKLTRVIVALGHDVHATDPDRAMLSKLEANLPGVHTVLAGAEDIPLPDRSVDVVVAAQAFHWFDLDRALPEIARVLRPGGRIALVWNQRNERIPWVRKLGRLIGTQEQLSEPADALIYSELFGFVEDATFSHWQMVDRQSIQDLVLSRSNVAVLDEQGRAAKLAEVLAFYDDYGRGMDGMQLPYLTRCFRAQVLDRPGAAGDTPDDTDDAGSTGSTGSTDADRRREADDPPHDGPDPDLLIDFR